ncbi:MAG: mannose-1-phosphate guanylyltransferase/mannose-6-phosphate isomerase [Pseudomonadales bacterium]|nr:mannose-1-phosphate guanylyltransferase/mannose-6-phosphate isomerase [Pseudomonadales bacterium]
MSRILPIIMAGGSGSRLWPLSRELHPKQFLALDGDSAMLQATIARLEGLSSATPLVICNEAHRFLVAEQLRQVGQLERNILLEPVGRNTAPAIALAALYALAQGSDPLLLVLAADHVIRDVQAFHHSLHNAIPFAEAGALVTFGIVARSPETGYGYIRRGESQGEGVYQVAQFVEKPNAVTAEQYVASGEYYWNSGLFLFRASRYLQELAQRRPDILRCCEAAMAGAQVDMNFIRLDEDAFRVCPDDSVDYAVMEKTAAAVVVPMDAGWNDIGAFSSLWELQDKDENGNVLQGDVLSVSSRNNLVMAESMLVATVGLEDTVVVQTKDAVLVAARERVQEVKQIVAQLKQQARSEYQLHREVYRPWGMYDSIDNGQRYQVKRITVQPGAKLSLQMHHHRAEHWIVVSGTAKVTVGEEEKLVAENESIYIPLGTVHALENPGKIPLELIEVQTGAYLGEDDIVRFEDRYGRVPL